MTDLKIIKNEEGRDIKFYYGRTRIKNFPKIHLKNS